MLGYVEVDSSQNLTVILAADAICVVEAVPSEYTAYDLLDNVTFTVDALGNKIVNDFDPLLPNSAVTRIDRGETSTTADKTVYAYDLLHRRQSVTDPDQNITTFVYDRLGRVTEEKITLNSVEESRFY